MMKVPGFLMVRLRLHQTFLVILDSLPVGAIPYVGQIVLMIKSFHCLMLLRNATDLGRETMATLVMRKQLSPTFDESGMVSVVCVYKNEVERFEFASVVIETLTVMLHFKISLFFVCFQQMYVLLSIIIICSSLFEYAWLLSFSYFLFVGLYMRAFQTILIAMYLVCLA